jgi:death-on-curing protein
MADTNHVNLVREFGGAHGIRDDGLIESALARPKHLWAYNPAADLADLAAAYGFGLAKDHGFVDGNKRTAFQLMFVFLGLNGLRLAASESDVVHLMIGVADDTIGETALATWVRDHVQPHSPGASLSTVAFLRHSPAANAIEAGELPEDAFERRPDLPRDVDV